MMSKSFRILFLFLIFVLPFSSHSSIQEYDWDAIDEEAFESFQPTKKIMDIIGIKKKMVIGEVGAGGGRVAVRVAKIVGPSGLVYANDITASALRYMKERITRENIPNMIVIEGTLTDPKFPINELDVVYLINTYRHLDKPIEIFKNIKPCLKKDGKLAIIELKRYGRERHSNEIVTNAELAGFRLMKVDTSLPKDDIYLFNLEHVKDRPFWKVKNHTPG